MCLWVWGKGKRKKRDVAEELIENFQSSFSSTITQLAYILQSQTESLYKFIKEKALSVLYVFSSFLKSSCGLSYIFLICLLFAGTMRPEENPLDLNNLPDDFHRDGKQVLEDISSSGCRKKKSCGKEGKEECGKVYECRFCSLKFCKSQALGGHMNRHRQERETETLNHARQLVFRSDHTIAAQGAPHLGCCQPVVAGGYGGGNMGDPTMPLRFPRYLSGSSTSHISPPPPPPPPPPPQPYMYASPTTSSRPYHQHQHHQVNDYYVGHVLHNYAGESSSYTCIGAPVGQGGGFVGGKDGTLKNQDEALNWGRSYSAINRFQDGF